jgi:hypothetical protein
VATGLQKAEKLCLRVRASCSGRNIFWPVKKLELANGPALSVPWGKGEPGEADDECLSRKSLPLQPVTGQNVCDCCTCMTSRLRRGATVATVTVAACAPSAGAAVDVVVVVVVSQPSTRADSNCHTRHATLIKKRLKYTKP